MARARTHKSGPQLELVPRPPARRRHDRRGAALAAALPRRRRKNQPDGPADPALPELGSSARHRPARPRRARPGDHRRQDLAAGRLHFGGRRGGDRRGDGPGRRLLPRLLGHGGDALRRCAAGPALHPARHHLHRHRRRRAHQHHHPADRRPVGTVCPPGPRLGALSGRPRIHPCRPRDRGARCEDPVHPPAAQSGRAGGGC